MGVRVGQGNTMQLLFTTIVCTIGLCCALPQLAPVFQPVQQITNLRTGEIIDVDVDSLDVNNCLVGASGERVCPNGAIGTDGQSRVFFSGNKGPGQTGSNGNAAPINELGQSYDPVAARHAEQVRKYTCGPSSRSRTLKGNW